MILFQLCVCPAAVWRPTRWFWSTPWCIVQGTLCHSCGRTRMGRECTPLPVCMWVLFFFVVALVAHCGQLLYTVYRTPWARRLTRCKRAMFRHITCFLHHHHPRSSISGDILLESSSTPITVTLLGESQKRPFRWTVNQTNECMAEGKNCKFWLELGSASITDQDYLLEWPQLCQIIQCFFDKDLACTCVVVKLVCEERETAWPWFSAGSEHLEWIT